MSRLGAWLRAARPLAQANIAPPILLGQALAHAATGRFDPELAAIAFGFGVLDHLVIVFINDYADRDADALADSRTVFSGGSRVIVDGLLEAASLKRAAIAAAVALLVGSTVAGWLVNRPYLPVFALIALPLPYVYSMAPMRLAYRGFGEVLQGLSVGVGLPLLGWYTQTGEVARAPLDALAPLVILGFASGILTAIPDHDGDAKADKQTWPVRRGAMRARRDALIFVGVGMLLVTQVGPNLAPEWTAVVVGPPAIAALAALVWLRDKAGALRFVGAAVGAVTTLQLTWSAALWLAH